MDRSKTHDKGQPGPDRIAYTYRVHFWIDFRSSKFWPVHYFALNPRWNRFNTCSIFVVFLQFSSSGLRLGRFWALRVQSSGRGPCASPSLAVYNAIRLSLRAVLFLVFEGGDTVTGIDSYSGVLHVTSRGTVGLEGGLLLCHSGSVRRRQSDEERGHHPFWWSCWCHDCIRNTYSLTRGQNNYYLDPRLMQHLMFYCPV